MQASRAFGCLQAVFKERNLTVQKKRNVYQACVFSVLLYSSVLNSPPGAQEEA